MSPTETAWLRLNSRLQALEAFYAGDLLEGLEVDRSPGFDSWLAAQRRRFRDVHDVLLQRLVASAASNELISQNGSDMRLSTFGLTKHLQVWRHKAGFEAEEHLSATVRLFQSEGIDAKALQGIWQRRGPNLMARYLPLPPSLEPPVNRQQEAAQNRRGSVAVMPFADMSAAAMPGGLSDALAHDVITRLAKLRNLRVIAQGTVFALRDQRIGPEEAGRILGVDYVVSGSVQWRGNRVVARIDLAETQTSRSYGRRFLIMRPMTRFYCWTRSAIKSLLPSIMR
jgi:TolB-like protein